MSWNWAFILYPLFWSGIHFASAPKIYPLLFTNLIENFIKNFFLPTFFKVFWANTPILSCSNEWILFTSHWTLHNTTKWRHFKFIIFQLDIQGIISLYSCLFSSRMAQLSITSFWNDELEDKWRLLGISYTSVNQKMAILSFQCVRMCSRAFRHTHFLTFVIIIFNSKCSVFAVLPYIVIDEWFLFCLSKWKYIVYRICSMFRCSVKEY